MNQPPEVSNSTDDEWLLEAFESQWLACLEPDPDETLDTLPPSIDAFCRRGREAGLDPADTLIELIRLDLEYRLLVAARRRPTDSGPWLPWTIEQYLEKFPELPLKVEWMEDEWRLRRRRGETIDAADWLRRFPPSAFATATDHQQFVRRLDEFVDQQRSIAPDHPATRRAAGDSTSRAMELPTGTGQPSSVPKPDPRLSAQSANPAARSVSRSLPPQLDSWSLLRPRFRQERVLGQGSFGTVWRAFDEQLGRWVAVKTLRPSLANDTSQRQSLIEEARAAAGLDHPDLLTIHDVIADQQQVHIVMQWIDGEPLEQWWKRSFPHPPDAISDATLARLIARISRAVHHAHLAGLIHCDLKPPNILIDDHGKPTVLDFGLAVRRSDQEGLSGRIIGTPAYMSPEQTWGETHHLDGRTDVWSLGVILYRLLVGRPPFEASGMDRLFEAIQSRPLTPCRQIRDDTPQALCEICERCLRKRIEDRYASAAELAEQLERFALAATSQGSDGTSGGDSADSRSVSGMLHPPGTVTGLPWATPELIGRKKIVDQVATDLLGPSPPMAVDQPSTKSPSQQSWTTSDDSACRLVTLTGVGGVGKTQTAVAIAREFARRAAARPIAMEAVWVELAAVDEADGLASSVLTALGVSQSHQSSAQAHLVKTLAVRGPLLIVLDNVEQIAAPAAQQVASWLAASRLLRVLVTSQVPLRIAGESVRPLSALRTELDNDQPEHPTGDHCSADGSASSEETAIEALELFIRRAREVRPGLELSADQRTDAIEICRLVDGNPLAIELAAARLGVLSVSDLRRRLGESFAVLKSHRTDRPQRHRTLFDVVRWSFELLEAETRTGLLNLAAWPAPLPMDLAERLLGQTVNDPLDTLEELASRQLIQTNDLGGMTMVGTSATVQRFASDSMTPSDKRELADRWIDVVSNHESLVAWLDQPGDDSVTLAEDGTGWSGRNGHVATNLLTACQWLLAGGATMTSLVRAVLMADQLAGDQWDSTVRISRLEPLLQHAEGVDQVRLGLRLSDAKRLAGQTRMAEMICRQTAREIELRLSKDKPSVSPAANEYAVLRQLDVRACRLLATILFRHGETEAAIEQLQAALKRLEFNESVPRPRSADGCRATVDVLLELTEIHRRAGQRSLALETLGQAEQQLATWRQMLDSPTDSFLQLDTPPVPSRPDPVHAFHSSQEPGKETPARPEWDSRMTRVQIQRGKIALQQGRVDEAYETFDQVIDRCRSTRDHRDWQQALLGRAAAAGEKGDFDGAGQDYDRCEKLSRRLGDLPTLAQSINNRALAYDDAGDSQRCCDVLQQALQIYRQLDDSVGIAIARSAGAAALLQLDRPAESRELLLSDEVQSAIPLGSIHDAIVRGDLGTAFHRLGQLSEAADSLRDSLRLLDQLGIAASAERLIYTIELSEVLDELGDEPSSAVQEQADKLVQQWPRRHRDRKRVADALHRHSLRRGLNRDE